MFVVQYRLRGSRIVREQLKGSEGAAGALVASLLSCGATKVVVRPERATPARQGEWIDPVTGLHYSEDTVCGQRTLLVR